MQCSVDRTTTLYFKDGYSEAHPGLRTIASGRQLFRHIIVACWSTGVKNQQCNIFSIMSEECRSKAESVPSGKKMNVLRVTMRSQIIRFRGKGMSASIRTQSRGYAFHVFKAALMG